ncbi:MAG: hypothetical protein KAR83_04305 [Thermodesulfovibrionales bacterium]|nr:hypothetical protein [Thermodesulfovibrionales bacterium]
MEQTRELLEASIHLELQVSELYLLYSETFQQDRDFWWKMALEEKNHAALLKSGRLYLDMGMFPDELIHGKIEVLNDANSRLEELLKEFRSSPPPMDVAYRHALDIETSAAELYYQREMDRASENKIALIFKGLNKDDKDHARRIESLMSSLGMI